MSNFTKAFEIASSVRTARQAQLVIAELVKQFASTAAYDRLIAESRFSHQSVNEQAERAAGNLLTSFVTRKPGGQVFDVES